MLRCLVAVAVACLAVPRASHADPPAPDAVALLPLDTDKSLELYGQPVARALARALDEGSVPVVVVGAKMAVPERARLIIDGTIALGKAGAVAISLRIRNRADGKVLDTLSATAPGLARLDVTAAELSARILPIVRDKLAALARPPEDHGRITQRDAAAEPPLPVKVLAIAVVDSTRGQQGGPLVAALDPAVAEWARAQHRQPRKVDPGKLDRKLAAQAVAASGAELAIGFWILDYAPETGELPMARARVRVEIADAGAVLFDRVVVTDTVLGDKGLSAPDLAARVARELLAILRPHVRRQVPTWR